jgi:hypothetical protein
MRLVPLLLAACVGYALGGWKGSGSRGADPLATGTVAQRFPQDWTRTEAAQLPLKEAVAVAAAAPASADPPNADPPGPASQSGNSPNATASGANASGANIDLVSTSPTPGLDAALLSPAPMVPPRGKPAPPPTAVAALPKPAEAPQWASVARPGAAASPAAGAVLNDAQIASIKQRLHLTPDQERMWPAVEVALRNVAYARSQEARRRSANGVQTADADAQAVQGLKSAAVPLIMSFNAEQKEEVRNLAHVMGLDALASQF